MSEDELILLFIMATATLAATAIGFAVAWRRERRRHERTEWRVEELESQARSFDRLQSTIESVAFEVERIGEIERFAVERLVAREQEPDRGRLPSVPPSSRVITPH